ncbi:unnamed protein product [Durusdinium trenchii]|uniref:Glycosyl transferase CAP10 domain-containing protein n=1 Tax=Durusdinium trenchii TaxID=1381693 RepID=A0ABP0HFP3_9DINO
MELRPPGNPLCWEDGLFSYDMCCGEGAHNVLGNPSCWEGPRSFQTCCLPSLHEPSCWSDARRFLSQQQLMPSLAKEERLMNSDLSLSQFCCRPGSFSSEVCWGGDGKGYVQEHPHGLALNISLRYVECCFLRLRAALETPPPRWMSEQISQDLQPWTSRLSLRQMEDFEEWIQETGQSAHFCRFQVTKTGVYHCNLTRGSHTKLVEAVRDALHVLRLIAPDLPELDLFLSQEEALCVALLGDRSATETFGEQSWPVPVLAQAQPAGCPGILMPWWAFLQQDWTRRYTEKLSRGRVPWESKVSKLFWRGSDTHCLRPHSCQGASCECGNFTENWMDYPRARLVLWSMLMPQKVDAKFTKDVVHQALRPRFEEHRLLVEEIVPPEKHVDYKFLMYLDGVSLSDRLFWVLLTESVLFKADSKLQVWLDGSLKAWEHYVPVAEDLTDLLERLQWAEAQDAAGQLHDLALRAAAHASVHFSLEANLLYLYHLLHGLKKVLPAPTPNEAEPLGRREQQKQQQMNARQYLAHALEMLATPKKGPPTTVPTAPPTAKLDCWTLGFTAELCCGDDMGHEGNPACWDEVYTFAACC